MGEHGTVTEIFYGGAWHTVPALQRAPVGCSRGSSGEGQEAPPSTAQASPNNATGDYNPRNPMSALYGLAGRNVPMRISADSSVRGIVEASSWKPVAVKGTVYTMLAGGGLLRRVQQGRTPLRAPLARAVLADTDVVGYWPLVDGANSDLAASGLAGGTAMAELGEVGFATHDGPAGAVAKLPEFIASGAWRGGLTAPVVMSDTGEWSVDFWFRGESDDPGTALLGALTWTVTGSWGAFLWHMRISETLISIRIDNDGDTDTDTILGDIDTFDGGWHHIRVCAQQDGSDVEAQLYVDGVLEGSQSASAMTIGTITRINVGDYAGLIPTKYGVPTAATSTAVGHVVIRNGSTDTAGPDFEAGNGYAGELAGVRFLRLGVEENIATVVIGDEADTPAMGPQRELTFVDNLRECVRTDGGLMIEPRDALAIGLRTLRSMYNQDAALTLDAQADCEPGLAPILDDLAKANRVTAKRPNGSEYTYEKTSGPLNINDPVDDPDGVGVYDIGLDVNPSTDARLIDHAAYAVARGTVDEPRWPAIVVNLDRRPSLVTAVNALELGDRIVLDNLGHLGIPDPAALIVIGISEHLPKRQRRVTLTVVPALPYEVAIVGANDGSTDLRGARVGTRLSTLNGAIDETDTSLVIDSGGVAWTTDADDWNVSLNGGGLFVGVGGEMMRVTNITGAGSAWTLTVVRSQNGIVKSHADNAPLYVWTPAQIGK